MARTTLTRLALCFSLFSMAACDSTTTIIHETGTASEEAEANPSPAPTKGDAGSAHQDAGAPGNDAGGASGPVAVVGPQPIPQIPYNGGAVLGDISMVTITVDGDAMRSKLEAFAKVIGTTPWWDSARDGYCDSKGTCVGRANAHPTKPTVHLPASAVPQSLGESDVEKLIDTNIMTGVMPVPTQNTIYLFYFPATTTISGATGTSCQQYNGYHGYMSSGGVAFAYAVLPRCLTGKGAQADFDNLTVAASHELAEAATDPFPANLYTGYGGNNASAWDFTVGGEVGDRCFDVYGQGMDAYQAGSYKVPRIWNNAAAKAGHDPCLPAPAPSAQPYFNITPVSSSGVMDMDVGADTTVTVQAFADGSISSGLSWGVVEVTKALGLGDDVLTVHASGSKLPIGGNGTVSVTLKSQPTGNYALALVRSQRVDSSGKATGQIHYWPLVVRTK
jgi:hypothetical protein